MPNHYFRFRQFTVHQDKCAMKVCTDACILGAWAASKTAERPVSSILDIGCGTGLLSLMLAQKTAAEIDALEINSDAAQQAAENCAHSPWSGRITVMHTPMQEYQPVKKYDLIISNPPFYADDLRSPDEKKNAAKHDTQLRIGEILSFIKVNLDEQGIAVLMIPFHRTAWFEGEAKRLNLSVQEKLFVRQTAAHHHFRAIMLLGKEDTGLLQSTTLTIHDSGRNYTADFSRLLKEYYLAL